jgi:hypothetical protein
MSIVHDPEDLAGSPATRYARADRTFYGSAAWVAAFVVLAGFAPTYYLKVHFGTPPLPSGLVHLHGLLMTAWFALFVVQVRLVATRRIEWHRRLGVAGIALAALLVLVGTLTAIAAAKAGRSPPGPPTLVFLAIPLGDMVVFPILFGLAIANRRRADYHKRFMLLASLSMLTAAIARYQVLQSGGLPLFFGALDLLLLTFIAIDTVQRRRLHPAFIAGFVLIVASQAARFLGAGTPQWIAFATWLTQ